MANHSSRESGSISALGIRAFSIGLGYNTQGDAGLPVDEILSFSGHRTFFLEHPVRASRMRATASHALRSFLIGFPVIPRATSEKL
jgi:hypothetical protein